MRRALDARNGWPPGDNFSRLIKPQIPIADSCYP